MVYAVGNTSLFGQNMETYPGNENATGPKENPINLGRWAEGENLDIYFISNIHVRFETVTINAQTLECVGEISFQNPYMQVSRKYTVDMIISTASC